MPEYFIKYDHILIEDGRRQVAPKYIFVKAKSGVDAWRQTAETEKEYNGLDLVSISKL